MAWTYAGDPAASNLATVRFLIGDTDTTDQLLNDAEITGVGSASGSTLAAILRVAVSAAVRRWDLRR